MERLEIPDLTMAMSVDDLYSKVAAHLSRETSTFELVSYGRVLVPGKTLGFYGIRASSVVFVFDRKPKDNTQATSVEPIDQEEAHRIVVALRTALVNPAFRNVIEKLKEKEHQDNLIAVTPGLAEDQTALSILLDFDLLSICTEHENIMRVLEKHPSLGTAATFLAAQFHEEHASADIFRRSPRPAYSLDDMTSDDEDPNDDAAQAAGSQQSGPSNDHLRQLLRDALAAANRNVAPSTTSTTTASTLTSSSTTNQPPARTQSAGSSNRITSEMLQMALNTAGLASTPQQPTSAPPSRDWSSELRQMRDMGLTNEVICIRALEMTAGNIEQAVEIYFTLSNTQ